MSTPNATYSDDCYVFHWLEPYGVMVTLDRLREQRGDLVGFVSVQTDIHGKVQSPERFNVMAPTARRSLAKHLEMRTGGPDQGGLDWDAMLNQVCELAMARWWEGSPVIDLAAVEPTGRPLFLVRPFILDRAPNVIFGDGSANKSSFSLALAVAVASGRDVFGLSALERRNVLYLDWEADEETHAERLRAICAAAELDVRSLLTALLYSSEHSGLVDLVPAIRRRIAQLDIGLIVVDSLGAARGGEPESAELTIRLMMAMRSWAVPVLTIDHVTKQVATDKRAVARPFGSNYTWNLGRNLWHMRRLEQDDPAEDETSTVVTLQHAKINRGPLIRQPYAYRVRHTPGPTPDQLAALSYERIDAMTIPELVQRAHLSDQIRAVLHANNQALTVDDIVSALEIDGIDANTASVGRTLRRYRNKHFAVVSAAPGSTTRWGLLSFAH